MARTLRMAPAEAWAKAAPESKATDKDWAALGPLRTSALWEGPPFGCVDPGPTPRWHRAVGRTPGKGSSCWRLPLQGRVHHPAGDQSRPPRPSASGHCGGLSCAHLAPQLHFPEPPAYHIRPLGRFVSEAQQFSSGAHGGQAGHPTWCPCLQCWLGTAEGLILQHLHPVCATLGEGPRSPRWSPRAWRWSWTKFLCPQAPADLGWGAQLTLSGLNAVLPARDQPLFSVHMEAPPHPPGRGPPNFSRCGTLWPYRHVSHKATVILGLSARPRGTFGL